MSGGWRQGMGDRSVAVFLSLAALAFHLLTTRGYGYFRDELYYLANGQHPAWGYVDHPPLIGWVAAAVRGTLGTSRLAIRSVPAFAAAAHVWITVGMTRDLGGKRFAQWLAGLATLLAPVLVSLFSILSMNALDLVFWALACWLLIRVSLTEERRLWLAFGVVVGVGLENKLSILLLGFAVLVSLLVSRRWDQLGDRYLWWGAGSALLLLLPYLTWQWINGWPLLEFMHNARTSKNAELSPVRFVGEQVVLMGPLSAPLWALGVGYFLVARAAERVRVLGWSYLVLLGTLLALGSAKPYYLAPIYAVLFAGGAVCLERLSAEPGRRWTRFLASALVLGGGVVALPMAKPVLSEDRFVRYVAALGYSPAATERHTPGRLPQFFADMHGWPELAETTAEVFRSLPHTEQEVACIFAQNYGQAGAIDLFGPDLGLPKAISGHNSYWYWGPGDCRGEVMIVIGGDRQELAAIFRSVERGGTVRCEDCMPYENDNPVWIGRGLRMPLADVWLRVKKLI